MAERVFRRVVSKHDKATCLLLFQPYVKLKEDLMIMKKCRKDRKIPTYRTFGD